MRTSLLVALPLAAALALAGCSSDDPDAPPASSGSASPGPAATALPGAPAVEAFAEGTCRVAAPDVLVLGADTARLGDGPIVDDEVKASLRDAQERLAAIIEGTEAALKPAFDRLLTTTGGVRLRADGNTYDAEVGVFMRAAYDALVAECTRARPSSAPTPS